MKQEKSCTDELLAEANASILFIANRPQVVMERGEGMYLWDTNGKKYLDFIGGWAVTSLGHSPKVISDALLEQSGKLVNASPGFFNKPMVEFARLLTGLSGLERVFFGSTGAEANESAIKLARKYGAVRKNGAYEIITAKRSFHGRSLATTAATGKAGWEHMFAPQLPGFVKVPYNDIEAMKLAITPLTCAIFVELIQGEGGVFEADPAYIQALRALCDEQGILLMFDEVQTGIGRTGTMFAYEHYGVMPDVLTLAKGIGGGFPLSAMLTREAYNLFEAGDQGGTYTGQPLAMAVGLAVVGEVLERKLPQQAAEQGAYLLQKLHGLKEQYGVTDIRGKGLLLAFDLPEPRGAELAAACLQAGLLINSSGPSTIRLIPALIVSKAEIDEMMTLLCNVMDRVFKNVALRG
ncbi:acetylornithine/succinylornithine family transaminase [Paenibacillus sp. CGMCC 1.16610]|uniref:Acetylornithine/succinylornithine family transaminase n=1 Tax=Paenibacillus anseongense TaxID=2682845 RepID=A0ABW9UDQ5_9BACL|nr:acetylornithine/succinylornithine family transaminase [Paenibacillus sp. CGMCC 1.16610]MBA2938270.1 acetylornithine/succinylornithine family transaminase [Paenibacillus sp. CGMCC 1.16610]MVQ37328.1 acetylornithine/succinylornithine family transaminase [Paenibacillus anseongense]